MPNHPTKPALTASASFDENKVTITISASVEISGLGVSHGNSPETPTSSSSQDDDISAPSQLEEDFYSLGYVPGPMEPTLLEREQIAQDQYQSELNMMGLPTKCDLRDLNGNNYVTAVKSQLGCGSCVAFGVIGAVECALLLKNQASAASLDLSEAHLYFCHGGKNGRTCGNYVDGKYEEAGGWWPQGALDEFKQIGVVGEDCYNYPNKGRLPPFPNQRKTPECSVNPSGDDPALCADWKSKVTKITGYEQIGGPQKMKEYLSSGKSALIASFAVYNDFKPFFRLPKNRKSVYRKSSGALKSGGHCVCVVGYDDNGGAGFWICKNSWGDGWADDGYFRIGYGQVGIDAYMHAVRV